MSEKMEKRVEIELDQVCGEKRGLEACVAVRDHVLGVLKLSDKDALTRVYYIKSGLDTGQWNAPASMTVEGKTINGGFRTRLASALKGHTADEVKAARGIAPASGETTMSKTTVRPMRGVKVGIRLIMDENEGQIVFQGEHVDAHWTSKQGLVFDDLQTLKTFSNAFLQFAGFPRAFVLGAPEYDEDGNPVVSGWKFGGIASTKDEYTDALKDILAQALAAQNWEVLGQGKGLMDGSIKAEKTGASIKDAFVDRFFPMPEPAPAPVISQPTETVDVEMIKEAEAAGRIVQQ